MASAKSHPSSLLVNVEELLKLQGVESQRVEFKKAWHNLKGTPRSTYWQIIHTITAFANDLYNVNGGYIIIGVEEKEDCESPDSVQVILPPLGVTGNLDKIQKEISGAFRENIKPEINPILQPVVVDGKKVLVLVLLRKSCLNEVKPMEQTYRPVSNLSRAWWKRVQASAIFLVLFLRRLNSVRRMQIKKKTWKPHRTLTSSMRLWVRLYKQML